MMWLWLAVSAVGAPEPEAWPPIAELAGQSLQWWADDTALQLQLGARRTTLPMAKGCEPHLQHADDESVVVELRCDGLARWTRSRLTAGPGTLIVTELGTKTGAEWILQDLDAARDWAHAEQIAARYRHLLQRHGDATLREQIVETVWDKGLAEWRQTPNAVAAADAALRFLSALPVWEGERPWDHHKRIALNAPMGQRANPERPMWLAPTPRRVKLAEATADLLLAGGQAVAAADLLERVVIAEPTAARWSSWADAAWAANDADTAREAYAEAIKLGATLSSAQKMRSEGR